MSVSVYPSFSEKSFLISQVFVPSSSCWNVDVGGKEGDVKADIEDLKTIENLGRNMARLT